MKAEETATGLQVLQDELDRRRRYKEFVRLLLRGDIFWNPVAAEGPRKLAYEQLSRKPELTESQKRMGLRSRRFIDQPEWTDWD